MSNYNINITAAPSLQKITVYTVTVQTLITVQRVNEFRCTRFLYKLDLSVIFWHFNHQFPDKQKGRLT